MTQDEPTVRGSRMHAGGKLSFRRRVPEIATDEDLPCVVAGEDPPALRELVPARFSDIEIEVGPGKGAFMLAAAQTAPSTFILGIEAAAGYARYAASRIAKAEVDNALLLVDNAKLYLSDRVPPGSLRRLHVYYPDPWPKRRHRGRRFFTDETPSIVHRALAEDGWFLVATDNASYAGQICRVLGGSERFVRDEDEEARLLELGEGHGFSPTNFERKYREEGRVLRRYAYRRR